MLGAILYIAYNIRIYYTLVRQFWPPGCELAPWVQGANFTCTIYISHTRGVLQRGGHSTAADVYGQC